MTRRSTRPTFRVQLIHWRESEAAERLAELKGAGFAAEFEAVTPALLSRLKSNPPDAVVIDLDRLPSQGRDVGIRLRTGGSTRGIQLVFAGGKPEKVERVKKSLPDAVFTSWSRISKSLRRAVTARPAGPVVPRSNLAGYSGTPLPKKLGIKENTVVVMVGAPRDFERTLGVLPQGVRLKRQARGRWDLALWFVRSQEKLRDEIERRASLADPGGLWIAWPKKSSGLRTDVTQADVRKAGLAVGLVDYKICAIDQTWSGLKFSRRKRRK